MASEDLFEKELMEKDALTRIFWDPNLCRGDFDVYYMDRFSNRLSKAGCDEIELEGDFFRTKDATVPMHRIRRITRKGATVWEKRRI